MSKVLITGGGVAGMMAAALTTSVGHEVHIYERNEKPGRKTYITGRGRCNVTSACDVDIPFQDIVTSPKFLYSSLYGFNNRDVMNLLEECRCPLKTEWGIRVLSVSGKFSDMIKALTKRLEEPGVTVYYRQPVQDLLLEGGRCAGLMLEKNREKVYGDAVVVVTGRLSYQATGSTGDGYWSAEKVSHQMTELSPVLVPSGAKEPVVKSLQRLALKNIEVMILDGGKEFYREFSEMLFTHLGASGSMSLSAGSYVAKAPRERTPTSSIDLKPAPTREQLDARLSRESEEVFDKQLRNVLIHVYPVKLLPVMVEHSGISPEKKANGITREERQRIVEATKNLRLTITGLRDYKEAIITQGGVSVKEVNPPTMESKRVVGLYFAGEVLDLDAATGGFNLRTVWFIGYVTGVYIEYV